MSAIFILKTEPPKQKHKFLIFLKGRYFVKDGPVDVNVGVFAGFLKRVVLQHFPKYGQSYVNLNVKSRPKFNSS